MKEEKNIIDNVKKKFDTCEHDIWLYSGSYCSVFYKNLGYMHYSCCYDEESKDFAYNVYKCLECGKKIEIKDWEIFEEKNFVLKNLEDIDVEKYIVLYYQLLYSNSIDRAKELVIEKFNKDSLMPKKKIKEK